MNLKALRAKTAKILRDSNADSPEADSGLIIMYALGIDKTRLLLGECAVSEEEEAKVLQCINRRIAGEPVQYITGECEFMSLKFSVNKNVLIPRADTEVLVEAVLARIGGRKEVWDIGCGSGCICISLAHYAENLNVTAFDISNCALKTARKNAVLNNVSDRIDFVQCDILNEVPNGLPDCIVSNPPYIRTNVIETLDDNVKKSEPRAALDGGSDGLIFYKRIANAIKVKKDGLLAFEIGYDQALDVSGILRQNGYSNIEVLQDLENRDRVVLGRRVL